MKVIKRKISLEQFKTRTPLLLNAFDELGKFTNFDCSTEFNICKTLECYPIGSYGITPCDLLLTINQVQQFGINTDLIKAVHATADTIDNYAQVVYDKTNECKQVNLVYYAIPYGTVLKMYNFFKFYNSLLKDTSCLGEQPITSATMYWETYNMNPSEEEYYNDLDNTFSQYGGAISVLNGKIVYENMDDYLINKVYKQFIIPEEYCDYWKTSTLFTLQALKWYYWFEVRHTLYENLQTKNDCQNQDDCCDCVEYFNRGGHEMFQLLLNFKNQYAQFNIPTSSATTSLDLSLFISNSIDDLGEFTALVEDWEGGVDYTNPYPSSNIVIDKCGNTENKTGGTIVLYDNQVWIKNQNKKKKGSKINDCLTFDFDTDSWEQYIERQQILPNYEYAYDAKNEIHIFTNISASSNTASLEMSIAEELKTRPNGWIVTKLGEVLPIEQFDYIFDNTSQTYFKVYTSKIGKRYVIYNGKKIFSQDKANATINLTKIPCIKEGEDLTIQNNGYFVEIHQKLYIMTNNCFNIDGYYYYPIYQQFKHNDIIYYLNENEQIIDPIPSKIPNEVYPLNNDLGEKVINSATTTNTTYGYFVKPNTIYCYTPYDYYEVNYMKGTTSSKLSLLQNTEASCDDMGNKLKGYYTITQDTKFAQPVEDYVLDLYYTIGNVNRLSEIYEDTTNKVKYYWGDILTNISIYYENTYGEKTSQIFSLNEEKPFEMVKKSWLQNMGYTDLDIEPTDSLKCEFEYYLGTILQRKDESTKYELVKDPNISGVKYKDICTLIKTPTRYYISDDISYNIYYYDIIPEYLTYELNGQEIQLPKTSFEIYVGDINYNKIKTTFSHQNALINVPYFKENDKIGNISKENINGNIYIERPIIKPIEKHMQLMDVMSLDALYNYGNGLINIINNN